MKRVGIIIPLLFLLWACGGSTRADDTGDLGQILSQIIKEEMNDVVSDDHLTSVFFLQNAECKCASSTLDLIHKMGEEKLRKVVVVVNNKDHFSLPRLANSQVELKYLSVNDLMAYGFFQAEDILVELTSSSFNFKKLSKS